MGENINNTVSDHVNKTSENWISQINTGTVTYDIATHHSITFKDGKSDTTGIEWNGLSDLEIVIPSIADIVQTPIEFIGTVGADGKVMDGETEITTFEKGNLVFITANCEFDGKVCEPGDMAIYNGPNDWKVVTGENQVEIVGNNGEAKTTIAIGDAKDVLTVEGKTLTISLDYAKIDKHVSVSKTNAKAVAVEFGDVTVNAVNLKLNQGDAQKVELVNSVDIDNATALANGEVTLINADSLVSSVDFGTWNAGTLASVTKNTEKKLSVTGGSLSAGAGSDFVTDVTLGDVTFEEAGEGDTNKIVMVTGITAASGSNQFVNGIHLTDASKNESANLTIAGIVSPTNGINTTFVEGLKDKSTKVLTSFTAGSFDLVAGDLLVTGFAEGSDEVISSVSATVNNDTPVYNSMSVSDHVLSFNTTNVASGVTVSTNTKKLQLTKTGFSYVPSSVTDSEFVTSGFTKADDVKYTFDKVAETTYTTTSAMWKLNTPQISAPKGAYTINNTGMVATVNAGTFVEGYIDATLPTWTGMSAPTVKVTGSVDTTLSTTKVTVKELKVDSINLPGVYTLTSVATGGDVTVGAAGVGAATIAESTVDLSECLADVDVTISVNEVNNA